MRGEVEIWQNDKLLHKESNLIVQGAGKLIADIMTVSPSLSAISAPGVSSILDASNYRIQAISFGTSKKGSEENAHISFPIKFLKLAEKYPIGATNLTNYAISIFDSTTSSYIPVNSLPKAPDYKDKVLEDYSLSTSIYVASSSPFANPSVSGFCNLGEATTSSVYSFLYRNNYFKFGIHPWLVEDKASTQIYSGISPFESPTAINSNGYPTTSIPSNRRYSTRILCGASSLDAGILPVYRTGNYILEFAGSANFIVSGDGVPFNTTTVAGVGLPVAVETSPGSRQIRFNITNRTVSGVYISVCNVSEEITNIRVYYQTDTDLNNNLWDPVWVDSLNTNFNVKGIRVGEFMGRKTSLIQATESLPPIGRCFWTDGKGVPIAEVCRLANQGDWDLVYCPPPYAASSTTVGGFVDLEAERIKNTLANTKKIYVEGPLEAWDVSGYVLVGANQFIKGSNIAAQAAVDIAFNMDVTPTAGVFSSTPKVGFATNINIGAAQGRGVLTNRTHSIFKQKFVDSPGRLVYVLNENPIYNFTQLSGALNRAVDTQLLTTYCLIPSSPINFLSPSYTSAAFVTYMGTQEDQAISRLDSFLPFVNGSNPFSKTYSFGLGKIGIDTVFGSSVGGTATYHPTGSEVFAVLGSSLPATSALEVERRIKTIASGLTERMASLLTRASEKINAPLIWANDLSRITALRGMPGVLEYPNQPLSVYPKAQELSEEALDFVETTPTGTEEVENCTYWGGVPNQLGVNLPFWYSFESMAYAVRGNLRYAADFRASGTGTAFTRDSKQWPTIINGGQNLIIDLFVNAGVSGIYLDNVNGVSYPQLQKVYRPGNYFIEIGTVQGHANPRVNTFLGDCAWTQTQTGSLTQPAIYSGTVTSRTNGGIQFPISGGPGNTTISSLLIYHENDKDIVTNSVNKIAWDPEFIGFVSQFNRIRDMELRHLNEKTANISGVDQDPDYDWATWQDYGPTPKLIIDLCNKAKCDYHFNIPASACVNVSYIEFWANYIKENLDKKLRVLPIVGNEIWNGSDDLNATTFRSAPIFQKLIAPKLGYGQDFNGRMQAQADCQRAVIDIFENVFNSRGKDERYRIIKGVETQRTTGNIDTLLTHPFSSTYFGTPDFVPLKNIVKTVLVAPYFPNSTDTVPWWKYDTNASRVVKDQFLSLSAESYYRTEMINAISNLQKSDSLARIKQHIDISYPGIDLESYESFFQDSVAAFSGSYTEFSSYNGYVENGYQFRFLDPVTSRQTVCIYVGPAGVFNLALAPYNNINDTAYWQKTEAVTREYYQTFPSPPGSELSGFAATQGLAALRSRQSFYQNVILNAINRFRLVTSGCNTIYKLTSTPSFGFGFRGFGAEWNEFNPPNFLEDTSLDGSAYKFIGPKAPLEALKATTLRPWNGLPTTIGLVDEDKCLLPDPEPDPNPDPEPDPEPAPELVEGILLIPLSSVFEFPGHHVNFMPQWIVSGIVKNSALSGFVNNIQIIPGLEIQGVRFIEAQLASFFGCFPDGSANSTSTQLEVYDNLVNYIIGTSKYTLPKVSGYFNAASSMDAFGYVNNIMSSTAGGTYSLSSPASGLVFSASTNYTNDGIIEYQVSLASGDLLMANHYGGIFHIGLWTIDMDKSLQNGNNPPFKFSVLNNPRKYRLFSKKTFTKNLCSINDFGSSAGDLNYSPLTIKWRLNFL